MTFRRFAWGLFFDGVFHTSFCAGYALQNQGLWSRPEFFFTLNRNRKVRLVIFTGTEIASFKLISIK